MVDPFLNSDNHLSQLSISFLSMWSSCST